jgi:glycerol-3-phosphate dehydrogenase
MAERIVDQVVEANGFTAAPCQTAEVALPGGGTATPLTGNWDAVSMERIKRLYGSEAQQVMSATSTVADLVVAEVNQAVLSEGALRLEDYWARRSSRAWFDEEAGLPILARAASAMGALLNWDATREAAEIENCLAIDAASRAGYANQHYGEGTTDAHRKAS